MGQDCVALFQKALNFLQDADAAQDCVQEVFIWLWTHRDGLQIGNVNSYLRQATRFQALKCIRENKAADNFEDRLATITDYFLASDALEFKELRHYIEGLISKLPEDQR